MPVTVVLGEQRGDEGKGRIVDLLAAQSEIVARFNGGPNAGHTVALPDGRVLKLHLIPSGIAYPQVVNIIGNGTYVDPVKLIEEIESIRAQGITITPDNLKLSSAAHVLLPQHVSADEIREAGKSGQGSTKSGIAQVASAKYARTGLRVDTILQTTLVLRDMITEDLQAQIKQRQAAMLPPLDIKTVTESYLSSTEALRAYITDTVLYLNEGLKDGKNLLAEGAQAFQLDIDHGMYPYTTSSSTTVGGVLTGLGVGPQHITQVIGVAKATQSHVGGGPFVTEVTDEKLLAKLRGEAGQIDTEQGVTTGRWRRMGHFDLPSLRRAQMVNGSQALALTKLDCVPRYGDQATICVAYEKDGQRLEIAPGSAAELETCTPVYETLPTWSESIQDMRKFDELPENARKYVAYIEERTGIPITHIGVGPGREQVIIRQSR